MTAIQGTPCVALIALALLAAAAAAAAAQAEPPQLRFSPDGTFKLVQLTDLHYGSGMAKDWRSAKAQRAVLRAEREGLGLAVLSGDLVTGFMEPPRSRRARPGSWFKQRWRRAVAPVAAAGVPYAALLGNHDRQADMSGREILQYDQQLHPGLSLTQQGPANVSGDSNYHLTVYDARGEQPLARIWVLDTGDEGCGGDADSWGCVEADALDWVVQTAASLPQVPTQLAVMHIPPPQVLQLWDSGTARGFKGEDSCCSSAGGGMLEAMKRAGIQAILFGHDHLNCFYGTLDGVRLAYGRKSGHGNYPYGRKADKLEIGARVVLLRAGQSAADSETWVRTEQGQRQEEAPATPAAQAAGAQAACSAPVSLPGWLLP